MHIQLWIEHKAKSDLTDGKTDPSLHWAHMSVCLVCHEATDHSSLIEYSFNWSFWRNFLFIAERFVAYQILNLKCHLVSCFTAMMEVTLHQRLSSSVDKISI